MRLRLAPACAIGLLRRFSSALDLPVSVGETLFAWSLLRGFNRILGNVPLISDLAPNTMGSLQGDAGGFPQVATILPRQSHWLCFRTWSKLPVGTFPHTGFINTVHNETLVSAYGDDLCNWPLQCT